jgi:hypothetical protein
MRLDAILSVISALAPLALARPWELSHGCPSTIKTTVSSDPCSYGEDSYRCTKEPQFSTMDIVHRALSNCPNITELDLRVTGLGCSEWPDRYNFPFQPAGGEKYPRLESLKLEGYQFGRRSWGREAWELPRLEGQLVLVGAGWHLVWSDGNLALGGPLENMDAVARSGPGAKGED